ncbi:MAG TPA: hypothetical protein VJ962_11690 [Clostridia bacterium]|nr:hypothetical protein [Clostridia bacterium]
MKILMYVYIIGILIILIFGKKQYNKLLDNTPSIKEQYIIFFSFITLMIFWWFILPILIIKKKLTT